MKSAMENQSLIASNDSFTAFLGDFSFNFLPFLNVKTLLQHHSAVKSNSSCGGGGGGLNLPLTLIIQYFSQYFLEKRKRVKKKKTVKITGLNITKRLVLTVALR